MFGMAWLKSIRAISLFIFVIGIVVGFLMGKISDQLYMTAAMVVITGFFSRPKSETNKKGEIVE